MTSTYYTCINGEIYKHTAKYAKTGKKYNRTRPYIKKNKVRINEELVGLTPQQCNDILGLVIEYKKKNNIMLYENINLEEYVKAKQK